MSPEQRCWSLISQIREHQGTGEEAEMRMGQWGPRTRNLGELIRQVAGGDDGVEGELAVMLIKLQVLEADRWTNYTGNGEVWDA